MTEHTKEPWGPNTEVFVSAMACQKFGPSFAYPCGHSKELCEANVRRIVACVNACAGLQTEYLEKVGLPEFSGKALCADAAQQELDRVTAQRDQLLAALKSAKHMLERDYIDDAKMRVIEQCDDAIAAVKGE